MQSINPMYIHQEIEDMTPEELVETLIYQFGHYHRPKSGITAYESVRMAILGELTEILRDTQHKSPLLKRALYLAELEDRCFVSLDMSEPLEPKMPYGDQTAHAC